MAPSKTFIYRDNTGGCNFRSSELNINQTKDHTEMVYIENLEIYRSGGFQCQAGNEQVNTNVTDTTAVLGIGEYRNADGVFAIYTKASGKAYVMLDSGGNETEIKSGLGASAVPEFVNFDGSVLCFNGADMPFIYDGAVEPAPDVSTPPARWSSSKPITACNLQSGRIAAVADSSVYWCKQGDPNDWTLADDAGSVTDIFTDVSGVNTIEEYGNAVAIHTASNRIYVMSGNSPTTYAVNKMASNRSATSKRGTATINDNQFFFSGDSILPIITTDLGVIRLGKDTEISHKIHPFLSGTERDLIINPIDRSKLDSPILLPYDKKNQLIGYFKSANTGIDAYDIAAIFSFDTAAWTFRKATNVTAAGIVNGRLLTGTSDGKILEEFVGTEIVGGNTFLKRLVTPYFDFGHPELRKRILRFYFWGKSDYGIDLTLRVRKNYESSIVLERPLQLLGASDAAAYGEGSYGVNSYASEIVLIEDFPMNLEADNFQFDIISNNSTQDFKIIGFGFEIEYLDAN